METLLVDGDGNITRELVTYPGQEYSLYAVPYANGDPDIHEPFDGTLAFFHQDPECDCPVLDATGSAVAWNIAAADGVAINFIAQSNALRIDGSGFEEGEGIRFNLVPVRS